MKNIRIFLSENFQFLVVKFSIYLNMRIFLMNALQLNGKSQAGETYQQYFIRLYFIDTPMLMSGHL